MRGNLVSKISKFTMLIYKKMVAQKYVSTSVIPSREYTSRYMDFKGTEIC